MHTGFAKGWEETSDSIKDTINKYHKLYPSFRLLATGHSLGGAVATIAAAYLRADGLSIDVYSYGSPRVGNPEFANFVTRQPGNTYRITHGTDIVAKVPPLIFGYAHTSPEYWISNVSATDGVHDYKQSDIFVCTGIANPDCNVGTSTVGRYDHSDYFGKIDGCKSTFPGFGKRAESVDGIELTDQLMDMVAKDRAMAKHSAEMRNAILGGGQNHTQPTVTIINGRRYSRQQSSRHGKLPAFVFYGDTLWPAEAKRQGGFTTPADILAQSGIPAAAYSLRTHLNRQNMALQPETYFLSTYETFGAAAKDAAAKAAKWGGASNPVVYLVHATPNMIRAGNEVATAGGILWSQVSAWTQVPRSYALPEEVPKTKQELHEHFIKAYTERPKQMFNKNPDYNTTFDRYTTNENSKLLDSKEPKEDFLNFMSGFGSAVGFHGKLPLLLPAPETFDGQKSAEAKEMNTVPAPHEEGVFAKIGHFIWNHPIAVASIPAVLALNLIPGVGEAADVAELAALSADTIEAAGVMAESTTVVTEVTPLLEGGVTAGSGDIELENLALNGV
ncbi:lipase (class 3) domain-containing protein [Hirsutella rhossiliensis]|uniref:Lipase (Class 3) domain-containing protein n=1 Tax=Hirsutella rhossiliensis TaxID=111463 RepID=A0A9P8SEK7_9HYPO|nr:lipase (class 3) domain-containing protein [Hirsutella rhossiliensis]KAH0959776.1 lipase (class 3) domain-containing protein [Hirsutella rhossiliensis]